MHCQRAGGGKSPGEEGGGRSNDSLTTEAPASELVGRGLREAGIEYVFGISGGHTGGSSPACGERCRVILAPPAAT